VRDAVLPARDPAGSRLGDRETFDPELRELEVSEPPPELELLELPPELEPEEPEDPDEPELDPLDPDEPLPRGIACAPARLGAARATETTRLSARRVDLAMVVLPRSRIGPLRTVLSATLLPRRVLVNT
jgi:hypothetical protein